MYTDKISSLYLNKESDQTGTEVLLFPVERFPAQMTVYVSLTLFNILLDKKYMLYFEIFDDSPNKTKVFKYQAIFDTDRKKVDKNLYTEENRFAAPINVTLYPLNLVENIKTYKVTVQLHLDGIKLDEANTFMYTVKYNEKQ